MKQLAALTPSCLHSPQVAQNRPHCRPAALRSRHLPPRPTPTAPHAAIRDEDNTVYAAEKLPIPFDTPVPVMAASDPAERQIYVYAQGGVYIERCSDIKSGGDVTGQHRS